MVSTGKAVETQLKVTGKAFLSGVKRNKNPSPLPQPQPASPFVITVAREPVYCFQDQLNFWCIIPWWRSSMVQVEFFFKSKVSNESLIETQSGTIGFRMQIVNNNVQRDFQIHLCACSVSHATNPSHTPASKIMCTESNWKTLKELNLETSSIFCLCN